MNTVGALVDFICSQEETEISVNVNKAQFNAILSGVGKNCKKYYMPKNDWRHYNSCLIFNILSKNVLLIENL